MSLRSSHALRVLVVDPDPLHARPFVHALEQAGAAVDTASTVADCLRRPLAQRALVRLELSDGSGLDLVTEMLARDAGFGAVLFANAPDHATTRAAWRAGALDLRDDREDPTCVIAPLLVDDEAREQHDDRLCLRVDRVGREHALRELQAFAVRRGLGPGARARLLTAADEALENAVHHGYRGAAGPIEIVASTRDAGLDVLVEDRGVGCDPRAARLDSLAAALPGRRLPGGLARIEALTDGCDFALAPEGGLRVSLFVADHALALGPRDLSEHEWLTPSRVRSLLADLAGGSPSESDHPGSVTGLSPALSATLGRLASSASPDRLARRALWN